MTCIFVQIRCRPGTAYEVAAQIVMREIHSELYSTSGDFDLLMKLYVPSGEDIGMFIMTICSILTESSALTRSKLLKRSD